MKHTYHWKQIDQIWRGIIENLSVCALQIMIKLGLPSSLKMQLLARASDLGVHMEEAMDHGQTRREQDFRNVQNFDFLAKTLADLGRFTQGLAPMMTTLAESPAH